MSPGGSFSGRCLTIAVPAAELAGHSHLAGSSEYGMNSPATRSSAADVRQQLEIRAKELGFDLFGITPAARPDTLAAFQEWLQQGYHGTMEYLPRRLPAYEHPSGVLPAVRTVIMLGMNYGRGNRSSDLPGEIAAYAQGTEDYHDVFRPRLKKLADLLHQLHPGCHTRGAVDTAPLLERDLARRAGLGWFGKNTMLINKHQGSFFLLGGLLTDVELPPDAPHETAHCGTCTRCLDACPTAAFPAPGVLDATRCISYLTIELRGAPIPLSLREQMGDWIFGCDVCQQVCPWNRKAPPAAIDELRPAEVVQSTSAAEFLTMTAAEFDCRFAATPLSRPGRNGLARNAAIALGNLGDPAHVPTLQQGLADADPLVREACAWALQRPGIATSIEPLKLKWVEGSGATGFDGRADDSTEG